MKILTLSTVKYNNKKYNDFLRAYCNWEKLESIFLSFDIDWAPDFILKDLRNLLDETNASFMVTHDSQYTRELENIFSVGTHPNLRKGSSQGDDIFECIDFYKSNNLSRFTINRFHVLGFAYPDVVALSQEGLKLDSSSLFLNHHFITPHYQEEIDVISAPYFWEDGMRLNNRTSYDDSFIDFECPGLKIFDFHPIDIFLNTFSIEQRNEFKNSFDSVNDATEDEAKKFVNSKIHGTRDILKELIQMKNLGKFKIYDLDFLNDRFRELL